MQINLFRYMDKGALRDDFRDGCWEREGEALVSYMGVGSGLLIMIDSDLNV